MINQPAPAMPMQYASAYVPAWRPVCPADRAACPINEDAAEDVFEEEGQGYPNREVATQDFWADMQRHVNDIKKAHLRWLPGRFSEVRRDMLHVACASSEEELPQNLILMALWPPVPRSKDLSKYRVSLDVHGHVIAMKLWAKAVLFVCRYDRMLSLAQKDRLCSATESILQQACDTRKPLHWYDRWRLGIAQKHLAATREKLQSND